jgi:predicted Co/Zn/Cd cation transporter (cation efflux family)
MSHRRPPLMRALQLNTAVLVVEIFGGLGFNSFSLIMDGIHNLSDEVALVLLVLAYSRRTGLSGKLLRYAGRVSSKKLEASSADAFSALKALI